MQLDRPGVAPLSAAMGPEISVSKGACGAARLHRAVGRSLDRALWLAIEVETLARRYHGRLQIGKPQLLAGEEIERARQNMPGHGHVHSSSKT